MGEPIQCLQLGAAVSQKLLDVLLRAVFLPLDIGVMVVLTGVERVVNKAVWGGVR